MTVCLFQSQSEAWRPNQPTELASSFPIEDWETGFYVVFIHTPKNYQIGFAAATVVFRPRQVPWGRAKIRRQRILQSKIHTDNI
jgi:hypothetical protein